MADDYDTVVKLVQAAHFHESHHPFQSIPRLHVFFDPFLKGFLLHLSSLSAEATQFVHFWCQFQLSSAQNTKWWIIKGVILHGCGLWGIQNWELRTPKKTARTQWGYTNRKGYGTCMWVQFQLGVKYPTLLGVLIPWLYRYTHNITATAPPRVSLKPQLMAKILQKIPMFCWY